MKRRPPVRFAIIRWALGGGTVVEINSSHPVMLSHPQDIASFIEGAGSASH